MKRKLTKAVIDKAVYTGDGKTRQFIWDTETKGLAIRIYPSEEKAFILSYRSLGRKRLMTLGAYGDQSIDKFREMADEIKVAIRKGADPLQDRQDKADAETLDDLFKAYIRRYATPHKKTWKADEKRLYRDTPSDWLNRKAVSITRNDIAWRHQDIGETKPYEANRYVALLRKVFNLAADWGVVPMGHQNPAARIRNHRETARHRFVTAEEMPALADAIDAEVNPYNRLALWGFLLTGLRKSELLQLRWVDVDLVSRTLSIPDTKAGRPHFLPLTQEAVELFESIPRVKGNAYVFCGRDRGQPIKNIDKPWYRVRAAAGLDDVRLHDLRRTVGSWLAQAGHSLHLVGSILNHKSPKTTAVYARFQQDQIHDALDRHGKLLTGIAKRKPEADVITLSKREKKA